MGFRDEVSTKVHDMRMMVMETLARLDDMAKMAEPPFKKVTSRAECRDLSIRRGARRVANPPFKR